MILLDIGWIDFALYASYLLILGCVVLAIGAPILYMIKHPESAKKTLISIGILVGVFLLSYALSGGEVSDMYMSFGVKTSGLSKLIGGGLILTYILGESAIIMAVYSEVSRMFK